MTLSALIKKGGLTKTLTATPATLATLATQKLEQQVTVAPVATVAVTVKPEPQTEQKRQPTSPVLSADEGSRIRAWLVHIEETVPDIITEVLDKCRADTEARRYFLQMAEEVLHTASSDKGITSR